MPKGEVPPRTENEKKHAYEADESAKQLVETIKPMHRPEAEKYVSENPPSPAVIVGMAFYRNHLASRKPRPDGLQVVINEIVAARPEIRQAELLNELRSRQGAGVIDYIDDAEQVIEWRDKNQPAGKSPISFLKDRLSRAKKKRRSR
jgi:hypothetical protein